MHRQIVGIEALSIKILESNHLVSKIEVYDSVESTQTIAKTKPC